MRKPAIEIIYCPKCGWLTRSAWMAQEILTTFADDVAGVTLMPAEAAGEFEIRVSGRSLWSRKADGGFPDIAELKRRVRDAVAPGRPLGHIDRTVSQ